ncbi:hypothetical protein AAG747_16335 [Rapidithrix thailandica]|uniref:Outer membrane protein beta-barrel domain-containing protein n=1 Tax=Rapidithrix thailandica TaxID=413964 RepID=A0AAW9SAI9_9BACT
MKIVSTFILLFFFGNSLKVLAQNHPADTVIINFGLDSKMIFLIYKKADLDALKAYDLNAIAEDIYQKFHETDSQNMQVESGNKFLKDSSLLTVQEKSVDITDSTLTEGSSKEGRSGGTRHSLNFDIGMNNYLQNGKFPDADNQPYSVKPWGSWYVGINSVNKTPLFGRLYLEWGGGVSWYNFKLEDAQFQIQKGATEVEFVPVDNADIDPIKSKLTASYFNLSLVPLMEFGKKGAKRVCNKSEISIFDKNHPYGFRIGVGGYAGYRLGSHNKFVYKENGDKKKDRDKSNFHLNNWRYGVRVQLGYKDFDLFVNYDLNELFNESRGPELNAFSFGITL